MEHPSAISCDFGCARLQPALCLDVRVRRLLAVQQWNSNALQHWRGHRCDKRLLVRVLSRPTTGTGSSTRPLSEGAWTYAGFGWTALLVLLQLGRFGDGAVSLVDQRDLARLGVQAAKVRQCTFIISRLAPGPAADLDDLAVGRHNCFPFGRYAELPAEPDCHQTAHVARTCSLSP